MEEQTAKTSCYYKQGNNMELIFAIFAGGCSRDYSCSIFPMLLKYPISKQGLFFLQTHTTHCQLLSFRKYSWNYLLLHLSGILCTVAGIMSMAAIISPSFNFMAQTPLVFLPRARSWMKDEYKNKETYVSTVQPKMASTSPHIVSQTKLAVATTTKAFILNKLG